MNRITRRTFLGAVAGSAAAAMLPSEVLGQSTAPSGEKMNVLFLMCDDMRVDLGCYASALGAKTPNLDALAKSGVRFDRCYCPFPLCNPSRSAMLTGHHPRTTGVLGNGAAFRTLHPTWISLPQLFRENGYASLRTGKIFHGGIDDPKAWDEGGGVVDGGGGAGGHNMVIPPQDAPPQPPDVLPPLRADIAQKPTSDVIVVLDGDGEGNHDYPVADRAIEYLRRFRDKPFFIGCGFAKPHSPPAAPQRFFDLYDPDKLELPPDFAAWPTVPEGFPKGAIRMLNADLFIGRGASRHEAQEVMRAYLAAISWADWNIGRVIAELDNLGLREKTVIVFCADHGYQLGEKGKWSKAGSLFEMGTRIPCIVAAPGAKGNGQSVTRIVQNIDLYRTLAELCGLPLPEGIQGQSLTPLLNDPQLPWDHPAYSVWSEDGRTLHGVAVRKGKWRYAEFGPDQSEGAMLLDEEADVHEMKNLADDPKFADTRAELSKLIKAYVA